MAAAVARAAPRACIILVGARRSLGNPENRLSIVDRLLLELSRPR